MDPALLGWLYGRRRMGIRPGLGRIRALLDRLGHPEGAFRAVLVAGTNGKGSTARALAAILTAAGEPTGRFLSPHLERYTERVAVDGREIEPDAAERLLTRIRPHAEAVGATFFEITAALAFLHFAEAGVRWAVLEVGLGGRLDATNVKDPALSLVTGIAADHTAFLGRTLAEIAAEKAGIFRPGVPALTAATGEGLAALREAARVRGTPLSVVRPEFARPEPDGLGFGVLGRAYRAPWLGRHQAANLALAVAAARRLGADEAAVRAGLAGLENPGRLEPFPPFLLDAAHNPDGARALARALDDHFPGRPRVLVFAASRDKDHRAMAEALRGRFRAVYLTRYPGERSADPAALAPLFPGAAVVPDPLPAVETAARSHPGALVVVAGSIYLLGAVRPWVRGRVGPPAGPPA